MVNNKRHCEVKLKFKIELFVDMKKLKNRKENYYE